VAGWMMEKNLRGSVRECLEETASLCESASLLFYHTASTRCKIRRTCFIRRDFRAHEPEHSSARGNQLDGCPWPVARNDAAAQFRTISPLRAAAYRVLQDCRDDL